MSRERADLQAPHGEGKANQAFLIICGESTNLL
jgi:hypothetical protein